MKIWIERDYHSGHLLVHTEEPVRYDKKKKEWRNKHGRPALWESRVSLDIPDLKPGEIMEFRSE